MEYEDKLEIAWAASETEKSFDEWMIDESERNHKKSVQMAGDLGEAFARIGELESKVKRLDTDALIADAMVCGCIKSDSWYAEIHHGQKCQDCKKIINYTP